MKTRKISLRTETGWETVENKSKDACDTCSARLYVAPDGKTLYCNETHEIKKNK